MTDSITSQVNKVQDSNKPVALPDLSGVLSDFILRRLPSGKHPLATPAQHHFKRTGKQLRGCMALAAGDSFGVPRTGSLPWAAAVEILHNASLVHDDICDGDMVRRGSPSVWALYGRDTALALGDWLIALSFHAIWQLPPQDRLLSLRFVPIQTGLAIWTSALVRPPLYLLHLLKELHIWQAAEMLYGH